MNLWEKHLLCSDNENRTESLNLHFEKRIDPELRSRFIALCRWLRRSYRFPVKLSVYVLDSERVILGNGEPAYGSFKCFDKRSPRIKIPARISDDTSGAMNREDEYDSIMSSLIHEMTHYYQWTDKLEQTDSASEWQANYYRFRILDLFYDREERKA